MAQDLETPKSCPKFLKPYMGPKKEKKKKLGTALSLLEALRPWLASAILLFCTKPVN
jgi:hypothetical protein